MSDDNKPDRLVGPDNWNTWKFQMKMFLVGKDLFDIVDGTEVLGENATAKEREAFRKRDNRALSIISLGVATDLTIYVRSAKSSAEAWKSLFDRFEEKSIAKICHYRKILYKMEYVKGQAMEAYVNHMKTVAEILENLDNPVSEIDLVYHLLTSLPPEYNNLLTALETLKKDQLTWIYVRDRVINEHARLRGSESKKAQTNQNALYTNDNNSGRKGRNGFPNNNNDNIKQVNQPRGSGAQQQPFQGKNNGGKSNNNRRMNLKCHNCQEKGHLRRDCPKLLSNAQPGAASFSLVQGMNNVNLNQTYSPEFALKIGSDMVNLNPTFSPEFALKVDDCNSVGADDDWCIDSGASQHMDPELQDFQNYQEFDTPLQVKLADDSYLLAPGFGDVCVKLYDTNCPRPRQFDVLLQNTLHVPDIGNKLFSISSVTEQGGSVELGKTNCILKKDGKEVGIGTKQGRLYKLNTIQTEHACNLAASDMLSTWHLRYTLFFYKNQIISCEPHDS